MNKDEAIDFLTANCSCWKGDKDKETLNTFPEEKIKELVDQTRLAQQGTVVNELRTAFNIPAELTVNAETIKAKIAETTPAPTPTVVLPVPQPKVNPVSTPANNAAPTKPQTLAEWEATIHPEALPAWNAAKEIVSEKKAELIANMTSHIADPVMKSAVAAQLNAKDIPELRLLGALIPKAAAQPTGNWMPPSFAGAGGAPVNQPTNNAQFTDDILTLPTMNWEDPVLSKMLGRKQA